MLADLLKLPSGREFEDVNPRCGYLLQAGEECGRVDGVPVYDVRGLAGHDNDEQGGTNGSDDIS